MNRFTVSFLWLILLAQLAAIAVFAATTVDWHLYALTWVRDFAALEPCSCASDWIENAVLFAPVYSIFVLVGCALASVPFVLFDRGISPTRQGVWVAGTLFLVTFVSLPYAVWRLRRHYQLSKQPAA